MALDYFTPIDELVSAAITEFAEITGGAAPLVPAAMIQVWEKDSDPLGDVEGRAWGGWIRIVPGEVRKAQYSSSENRYELPYAIEYGHKGLSRERCNLISTAIHRAVERLNNLTEADGVTPITQPSPMRIESCESVSIDRERQPIDDPEEWSDAAGVVIVAFAARETLAADEEDPEITPPTVVSTSAAFDSASTAAAAGKVTALGGSTSLIEVGVCWATHATPTTADFKTVIASGVTPGLLPLTFGADAAMIGLAPGTTYYARLYAVTAGGTGYGADIQVDYPFAEPVRFTYDPDLNTLSGTFTRTLHTTSSIPNTGWSAVVPTGWEYAPRWTMCFTGEVGSASGMNLTWNGSVDEESEADVTVVHTIPDAEFADEWGVPVPAFACANVTLAES
jgi:hypothetical protein